MAFDEIVCAGNNLLGDCLCTTPTVHAFRKMHPDAKLVYVVQNKPHCRVLEGNPDIDHVIYTDEFPVPDPGPSRRAWLQNLGIDASADSELRHFDIHALHRSHPAVFKDHLSRGFARMFAVSIDSVRPVVTVDAAHRDAARALLNGRTIVFGMHTTSPVVGKDRESTLKDWVVERWLRLARELRTRGFDIIAVGSPNDQRLESRYLRNFYGLPILVTAALLAEAACVVTVESGLSHLCHAVDARMVLIFSRDVPLEWAAPEEATRCRVIYDDPRFVTCERVLAAIKSVMAMRPADKRISASTAR